MADEILRKIQSELVAPKSQFNDFGKYKYRSCEDILEALKPILTKHEALLTITDSVVLIGTRYYIKASVTFRCGDEIHVIESYAREAEAKKGMDEAQITGAASSYARKYALNGMFCIDDNEDADASHTDGNGYIDEKQKAKLVDGLTEKGLDGEKFLKAFNITGIEKLPKKRFTEAMDAIKKAKGTL